MTKQQDLDAIRQLLQDWHAGWLAGDAETLLALLTDDPLLLPWGQPAVSGRDGIRALYQGVFRDFAIRGEMKLMEVEVSGDLGYFWCTYRLRMVPKGEGEALGEEGKAVFIVKRAHGGAWKIARLIDNSDRVPAVS